MQLFVTNESKPDILKEQKLGQCHKTNLGARTENQSMTGQLIIIKSPVKQKKKKKKKAPPSPAKHYGKFYHLWQL